MSSLYAEENKKMIAWMIGKSAEHRHFVAMNLNWDFAEPTLDWVVNEADCDLATAVELFWKAGDSELLRYPTIESVMADADYFEWSWLFVKNIVDRANKGNYARRTISYDVSPDIAKEYEDLEDECRGDGLPWIAPREFRASFRGVDIDTEYKNPEYWSDELNPLFKDLGTRFTR